jgi:hypothetical protein
MKHWLIVILLFFLSISSVQGQTGDDLPPIMPENAARVTQLGSAGSGEVTDLAWSPDGRTLALGTSIGTWLYDPADLNAPPRLLLAEPGPVTHLTFSPDSAILAVLSLFFQGGNY